MRRCCLRLLVGKLLPVPLPWPCPTCPGGMVPLRLEGVQAPVLVCLFLIISLSCIDSALFPYSLDGLCLDMHTAVADDSF